ncbi:MAG: dTDP-4-dehydrorhamnose reductase [Myxococcota bacterium]
MRIFVAGDRGQLGTELHRAAWPQGTVVTGADLPALDITEREKVAAALETAAPDILINASAYTAVDKAESERERAFAVNETGPRILAELAAARGIPVVHVSTDYVFDGEKTTPYLEDDPVAPLGVYGASKEAGERAVRAGNPRHLLLRTSWVYAAHGANFVRTMIRLAGERDQLRVVHDQRGRPTSARQLAGVIARLAPRMREPGFAFGTYHFAGAGACTWWELASATLDRARAHTGRRPEIIPITTAEYPTPARRPKSSVLDTGKLERSFGLSPEPWTEELDQVIAALFAAGPNS